MIFLSAFLILLVGCGLPADDAALNVDSDLPVTSKPIDGPAARQGQGIDAPVSHGVATTAPSTPSATSQPATTQPSSTTSKAIRRAMKLRDESRFLAAEKLLREHLNDLSQSDGELTSISASACKRSLAIILADQGQEDAAEKFALESYAALKATFPIESYPRGNEELARSAWALGNILMRSGRADPAQPVLLEALFWFEVNMSSDWETPMVASDYGECLLQQGKFAEAEDPIVIGYNGLRDLRGQGSFETLKALERVFALYKALDQPEKVAEYEAAISDVPPLRK